MDYPWYEKFEEYLSGKMNPEEKLGFEAELSSNHDLATAFRVYRTIETEMRQKEKYRDEEKALKASLQTLNKRYFETEQQRQPPRIIRLYPKKLYQITAALAASIVIILVAYFLFFRPHQDIQNLADTYYKTHLQQLSQTMDPATDSLQAGIAAYNNQDYNKALQYFQGIYHHHPDNSEAKRNIGLVYLATKDYDKALQAFDELATMKHLYSNPGLFLKALTLMQRNQKGDAQQARQLLEQVVQQKAEGSREAAEWLKRF
jgi:tetratricopeptide (TPR) repeat protein